jgi:ribonucleoside-diphosphate reductase alpha chain
MGAFLSPSSYFTYIRSYSRWIDELGRRETWEETVDRYVNFMREERGSLLDQETFQEIRRSIVDMEVMPSMRALWAAGSAAKADNVTMFNCSYVSVDSIEAFSETLYILMCGTGLGFSVEKKHVNKLPQTRTNS